MNKALESELTLYFKGLKHKLAKDAGNGEGAVNTDKDPLMFDLYYFLSEKMLTNSSKEKPFAHAYMVIAWNRMCRSSNAFGIRHSHMEWRGEAQRIYFAHMKNDQGGDRHVTLGIYMPTHCSLVVVQYLFWVLLASSNFDGNDLLFPGSNQYERFRKCWLRLLSQEDVAAELKSQGLELGAHSMRKRSATFCSLGSTACPSSIAVHLRAGWSLGGVQNTYLRYEAAGDTHVGRTVVGLSTESYKLSTLAPHFEARHECVANGMKLMFLGLPKRLEYIAEYCLASRAHHSAFLRTTLSQKHHVFETPIFQDENSLSSLTMWVKTGDGCADARIRPTGVHPHISILCEMKELKEGLLNTLSKIEATRVGTVKDIIAGLEKRGIGSGTGTYDRLHDVIKACLHDAGVADLVEKLSSTEAPAVDTTVDDKEAPLFHFWGGKFRRIPADFIIPDCSVRHMWVLWMRGNKSKHVPPLRVLDGRDMPNRKIQKRLIQPRNLIVKIEKDATSKNLLRHGQTMEEAAQVFLDCADR